MNDLNAVPFEDRIFPMVQFCLPGAVELRGYTTAAQMTSELVERIVVETETAIGEPIRHVARKLFPKPLDVSLQEEVELAWKAPKRVLHLSNQVSRPNYVMITASRFPRPTGGAFPADWGQFSIQIKRNAPDALNVLTRVGKYAALAGAFFIRADSPQWWDSRTDVVRQRSDLALVQLRIKSDAGWSIGERIGWVNYFAPQTAKELGLSEREAQGGELWLTKEPFTFGDEAHVQRYVDLIRRLAPHRVQDGV